MNTKVEEVGDCRKKVAVELGADEIRDDYESVVKVFTKNARIPGFRPGKAPRERIEARYRKEIEKETQDAALPRAYHKMLEKEAIEPVALVDIQDVSVGADSGLQFTAVLDVKPEFKLPKYKKLAVKSQPVEVKDSDVDEAIKEILQRMARYVDTESGTVEDQDLVQIDYQAQDADGKNLALEGDGVGDLTEGKEHWLPVAGDNELIPGLLDALRGKEIGATVTFTAKFPKDFRVAALAGQKIPYTVNVRGLRKMEVPALDDEILQRIGMESEDALRKRVRSDLESTKQEQEDMRQREEVNRFLLDNTKLSVPESQVANERNTLLRSVLTRMAQQGATREMMEQHRDELMANVSRQAEERVKVQYILGQIAEEEEISVEPSDVEAAMEKLAERHGMSVEKLRAEVEKQENGMAQFESDVLRDKVIDFLLSQAKIK